MALANLNGKVLDDKYQIERQLGKGGMGAVYLATHLGTDRPVALKVIAPQFMMNDEFVERFRREAKAAGRLHHPNVVNVTDFGFATVDDRRVAYLVMEYLDGCSLAEILEEETTLPIAWTVDIVEQACSALDEAHRHGVVHRDLKPDNLWLEPNRRGGYRVKVLDFGLAKLDAPVLPEAGDSSDDGEITPSAINDGDTSRAGNATRAEAEPRSTRAIRRESEILHSGEAATRMMRISEVEEAETRVLTPETEPGSSGPRSQAGAPENAAPARDDQTRVLDTAAAQRSHYVGSSTDGLTRVGSVLGTPVYMSPEQCRAEPLDARSDIYSLGVIAYQMLAGEPPFKGSMSELMRQHSEVPPPPLRSKRKQIPNRMAQLVMSALAKSPADRPTSAAGFASALRAYSEGTWVLLRRAISLYSEYFPKFVRVSLVVYLPVILFAVAQFVKQESSLGKTISPTASRAWDLSIGLLSFLVNLVAASIVIGVTIRMVTQLNLAPTRPLRVRIALRSVKKRLWPLLKTTVMVGFLSLVLFPLGVVPGVIFYINSSLTGPVVIMENIQGWTARKRSKTLVRRARRTVIATILIQYLIPAFASSIAVLVIRNLFKNLDEETRTRLLARAASVITTVLNVFISPLIAVLTALLYLKARQAGGETLREALSQFEEEDAPRTRWQMRMRERLTLPTQTGR